MNIEQVDIIPFEPRFAGAGYVVSDLHHTQLHNQLIRLTLDDGTQGAGENVRSPRVPLAACLTAEAEAVRELDGLPFAQLPSLLGRWRERGATLRGLAFGVETALYDIMSGKTGMPIASLLGGPPAGSVADYLSLSCDAPDALAADVKSRGANRSVIQVKLGNGAADLDIARVAACLDSMRPDQMLLADFNGALTPDEAVALLPRIHDPRLMWEEPCRSYDDNVTVARAIAAPVLFDQCLSDVGTYLRAVKNGAAAAVVIKLPLLGGLEVARTARDICIASGMRVRIDGPWCGQIGASVALSLSLGVPDPLMIASIDLTEVIETDRELIKHPMPGRVGLAQGGRSFSEIFATELAKHHVSGNNSPAPTAKHGAAS